MDLEKKLIESKRELMRMEKKIGHMQTKINKLILLSAIQKAKKLHRSVKILGHIEDIFKEIETDYRSILKAKRAMNRVYVIDDIKLTV